MHGLHFLAGILIAIGFALLLAAGLTLRRGNVTRREGLFGGLAGFATFAIAPGLGVPPEVRGTVMAALFNANYGGSPPPSRRAPLSLCSPSPGARRGRSLAAVLIVLRHLYGAPHLGHACRHRSTHHQFAVAAAVLFWLMLGAATRYFYGSSSQPRLQAPADKACLRPLTTLRDSIRA
jgi:predicted cobalt transporter CbtA